MEKNKKYLFIYLFFLSVKNSIFMFHLVDKEMYGQHK